MHESAHRLNSRRTCRIGFQVTFTHRVFTQTPPPLPDLSPRPKPAHRPSILANRRLTSKILKCAPRSRTDANRRRRHRHTSVYHSSANRQIPPTMVNGEGMVRVGSLDLSRLSQEISEAPNLGGSLTYMRVCVRPCQVDLSHMTDTGGYPQKKTGSGAKPKKSPK